jgi:hypothetical protein
MAKPNTTFLYNNTANDGANSGNASGGAGASSSNWVVIDLTNDAIWWLDSQQTDGDADDGAIYPVIIPGAGSIEAPKTFIKDDSEGILDQVPLAGTTAGDQDGGNTRYVFAIYFDGVTAGIPYLEAWNDNTHAESDHVLLGDGTPGDSTYIAIGTTAAAPGSATWTGTPLAGSGSRVSLAAAALASAQNVYFNIRRAIASSLSPQDVTDIVLSLRYLYS